MDPHADQDDAEKKACLAFAVSIDDKLHASRTEEDEADKDNERGKPLAEPNKCLRLLRRRGHQLPVACPNSSRPWGTLG